MFGVKFIKVQPTTYVLEYRGGRVPPRRHRLVLLLLRANDLACSRADRELGRPVYFRDLQ